MRTGITTTAVAAGDRINNLSVERFPKPAAETKPGSGFFFSCNSDDFKNSSRHALLHRR
jgi:hypothetical protein